MKKLFSLSTVFCLILISACGNRPQYKTKQGKKKLKHYNSIQYDKH